MSTSITSVLLLILVAISNGFLCKSSSEDQDICLASSTTHSEGCQQTSCFRVAALELDRAWGIDCYETTRMNLEIFEQATISAAKHGAKLIVFPEDGIMYEPRDDIVRCAEEIPDPDSLKPAESDPCSEPSLYNDSMPVLVRLSCLASRNNMYVIANYATKQKCAPGAQTGEEKCPTVGYFLLNTDVVFDPSGKFIKRYRKYHIFSETEIFDKAPDLEHAYFDTPFGRFGLFTCFDIIFKRPAVDLVEQFNVSTVIFPTWWFDELPLLTAVQLQDGWSWKHNVNLISSNILRPSIGSAGSAIISNKQLLNTGASNNRTRLLIANIEKPDTNDCQARGFKPVLLDVVLEQITNEYAHKNTKILTNDSAIVLDKNEDKQSVCTGDVCCVIDYKFEHINRGSTFEKLMLIGRDSSRAGFYGWYEQSCSLATIDIRQVHSEATDNEQRYRSLVYREGSAYTFSKLSIKMTSTTPYVYPIGAIDTDTPIERNKRYFGCDNYDPQSDLSEASEVVKTTCEHGILTQVADKGLPIYSFGMYARRYESDVKPTGKIIPREHFIPGKEL